MRKHASLLILLLLVASCHLSSSSWPRWANRIAEKLECGMTPQQVKRVAERELIPEEHQDPWLGGYRFRKGHSDLWLKFNENRQLEFVTLAQVDGWRIMRIRLSPRRNLCTGELTFRLRINWSYEVQGADLYLDGVKIDREQWIGPFIEVTAGNHELRLEKPGIRPVVKSLSFGPEDRGNPELDLNN